jgi:ribosome recycling factor
MKDKLINEDIHDQLKEQIQELTKQYEGKVNSMADAKEKDIMGS